MLVCTHCIAAGLIDTPSPSSSHGSARTADIRARELADVALKAYEAGGKALHVPLGSDHPLVVILKEVLGTGSSGGGAGSARELSAVRAGAAQVAQALLNMVLQQQVRRMRAVCSVYPCLMFCLPPP